MTEDFALIDFALSARTPAELAEAIGRLCNVVPPAGNATKFSFGRKELISRLFGRKSARQPQGPTSGLRLHPHGTLIDMPLMRVDLAEAAGTGLASPVRLSGPLGEAGLTLIELCDDDGETSAFFEKLSGILPGDEIFYFRHSGSRHPGAHYAFHIYRDGRVTRRAVSSSFEGTAPEAPWFGLDTGMPHPLETDSLPKPGTPSYDIMTPMRQGSILEALGMDPETIFVPSEDPMVAVLELCDEPGGRPVSDARAVVQELRRRAILLEEAEEEEVDAGAGPDIDPGPGLGPENAEDIAPPPAPEPDPAPPQRPPWEEQVAAPSWEEEVTALLVGLVEAALPPEEQVEWLDRLTAQLIGGDIDGALEEAGRMIAAGNRSEAEKEAVITRLARFFGRAG
ncbi:MAG: hypothetical protein ACK5JR_04980 [Tropicimonas sp.]|uniref:hypothetical protein n=1 Tax=Tropicimonas sp. TaxID=2067044 RepID=UPI003A868427